MSLTHAETIECYKEGKKECPPGQRHYSNLWYAGDVLYSYGEHFPLVVRLSDGSYIVNGDRYSSTTNQHQSRVFRFGPQVPFSALMSAGLYPGTLGEFQRLRVVDKEEDRWTFICRCGQGHTGKDGYWSKRENGSWHCYSYGIAGNKELMICTDGHEEHTLGGTLLRHRRRYLLSGIDHETSLSRRLLYFLVELPRKATSLEDAYNSLIPEAVRQARAEGIDVQRQGDWFFVKTVLPTLHLRRNGYERTPIARAFWDSNTWKGYTLDGTNHLTTEAREKGGVMYVRGTVRHAPREHRMLRLGKDWWRPYQNLAKASWAAAGTVD